MWTMSPPHEDVCQWEDQGVKSLFIKCGKDVCCSAAVCDICCDIFYRTIQCQVCFVARCLAVCCLQYLCPLRLCNYYKNEQLLPAIYNSPWQIFSSKMAFVLWSSSLCPSCLTSGVKCLCYLAPQHVWSVGSWIWGRQYRILCRRGAAQHSWVKHRKWGHRIPVSPEEGGEENHGGLCAPSSHWNSCALILHCVHPSCSRREKLC